VLQVSSTAVSVLNEARSAQEVPDSFGVRVFAQPDETGQAALALAFTEEPAEGDQVTEQDGTEIYVAPELAEPLAESVLDVEDTPEGPQLTLVQQDDEEQ
jgi:Fe-S cluster assembly iron-binding protein IscA